MTSMWKETGYKNQVRTFVGGFHLIVNYHKTDGSATVYGDGVEVRERYVGGLVDGKRRALQLCQRQAVLAAGLCAVLLEAMGSAADEGRVL